MQYRRTDTVAVAAAKASLSPATGYRLARDPRLPSMKKGVRGRRRPDPLGDLFETEVVPLIQAAPGLRPIAIFEDMLRRHPELGANSAPASAAPSSGASALGAPSKAPSRMSSSGRPTSRGGPGSRTSPRWPISASP